MKRVTVHMTRTEDGIRAILTAGAHRTIMTNGLSDKSSIIKLTEYRGTMNWTFE